MSSWSLGDVLSAWARLDGAGPRGLELELGSVLDLLKLLLLLDGLWWRLDTRPWRGGLDWRSGLHLVLGTGLGSGSSPGGLDEGDDWKRRGGWECRVVVWVEWRWWGWPSWRLLVDVDVGGDLGWRGWRWWRGVLDVLDGDLQAPDVLDILDELEGDVQWGRGVLPARGAPQEFLH